MSSVNKNIITEAIIIYHMGCCYIKPPKLTESIVKLLHALSGLYKALHFPHQIAFSFPFFLVFNINNIRPCKCTMSLTSPTILESLQVMPLLISKSE